MEVHLLKKTGFPLVSGKKSCIHSLPISFITSPVSFLTPTHFIICTSSEETHYSQLPRHTITFLSPTILWAHALHLIYELSPFHAALSMPVF